MILPIYTYGQPVLRKIAQDIPLDYEGLPELIQNMFETMAESDGIGLAAPQIGKDIRVVEKYEFFLICRGKQVFFVLPKYALYDNQAEIIRSVFKEKLGKRFRCKF